MKCDPVKQTHRMGLETTSSSKDTAHVTESGDASTHVTANFSSLFFWISQQFFLVLFALMLMELTAACLLLMYEKEITQKITDDLNSGLKNAQRKGMNSTLQSDWDLVQELMDCCGVHNFTDWGHLVPDSCCQDSCSSSKPKYRDQGCLVKLNNWFEENFLTAGISVIILCIIEVLGMCFAMTLFCHISRSGLGYKL